VTYIYSHQITSTTVVFVDYIPLNIIKIIPLNIITNYIRTAHYSQTVSDFWSKAEDIKLVVCVNGERSGL